MKSPEVSVLTPVYNAGKYLREMMDSILQQTMRDFEFVIINDGSTDDTEAIIKSYDDPRIKYFSNDGNKGHAYSFNRTLELASGEFLAVAEADDVSHPRRLEILTGFMRENKNVGVVAGAQKGFYGNSPAFRKITNPYRVSCNAEDNKHGALFFGHKTFHASAMYRASVLKQHNIKCPSGMVVAQDYALLLFCSRVTDMVALRARLLHYRRHAAQTSGNSDLAITETNKINREFYAREFGFELGGDYTHPDARLNYAAFAEIISVSQNILRRMQSNREYDSDLLRRKASELVARYLGRFRKSDISHVEARRVFRLYKETPQLHFISRAKKAELWVRYFALCCGVKF